MDTNQHVIVETAQHQTAESLRVIHVAWCACGIEGEGPTPDLAAAQVWARHPKRE